MRNNPLEIVYVSTCLATGKKYVGACSKSTFSNPNYYGSGILLAEEIDKFGVENFERVTLEKCDSEKKTREREMFWMRKLKTSEPNGYNKQGKGHFVYLSEEEKAEEAKRAEIRRQNWLVYKKLLD